MQGELPDLKQTRKLVQQGLALLYEQHQPGKALPLLQQAQQLGYSDESGLSGLAQCLLMQNQLDAAMEVYQTLLDQGAFTVAIGQNMGLLLVRRRQYRAALKLLERACSLNKDPMTSHQLSQTMSATRELLDSQGDIDDIFNRHIKSGLSLLRRLPPAQLADAGQTGADGCAVIVEDREHPWLEHALRNVTHFLPDNWKLLVVHGTANAGFVRDLLQQCGLAGVTDLHVLAQTTNINRVSYSALLKSAAFWQRIPAERALIFQTDCMLLGRGLEAFYDWDYVGAPWNDFHTPQGVGNGGLSLRNVTVMQAITENFTKQSPPTEMEDVFFARMLHAHQSDLPCVSGLASRQVALDFALECRLQDQPDPARPLGLHQAWRFFPEQMVSGWFSHVLEQYRI
ncbi:MAG TPA: tetratricopeptide repeat protein [Gammaproteobacteria bacterium]|nr:tetratricopeptide repeat protein [Gammaproteobacteria bacterium]